MIFLDIETIPTDREDVREMFAATLKPPANYKKAETIEKWHKFEKANAVTEAMKKTALDGAFGQVFCICWAMNDYEVAQVNIGSKSEKETLTLFADALAGLTAQANELPIVGHNVATFDIRFIWQRCMIHGIQLPHWFPQDPKPWDDAVFDTMTAFAGARNMISLDKLCMAFGIPNDDKTSGADVAKFYAAGEYDKIIGHCKSDVEKVRQLHKRMERAFA